MSSANLFGSFLVSRIEYFSRAGNSSRQIAELIYCPSVLAG